MYVKPLNVSLIVNSGLVGSPSVVKKSFLMLTGHSYHILQLVFILEVGYVI